MTIGIVWVAAMGGSDRRRKMGHDDIDSELNQLGSKREGTVASPSCVTPLDRNILALHIAERLQTSSKGVSEGMRRRRGDQRTDTRQFRRLLRKGSSSGANQGCCTRANENTPVDHVIDLSVGPASSAITSSVVFTSAKTRAMVLSSASCVSRLTSATASATRIIR
jgi:hypothetical protein